VEWISVFFCGSVDVGVDEMVCSLYWCGGEGIEEETLRHLKSSLLNPYASSRAKLALMPSLPRLKSGCKIMSRR